MRFSTASLVSAFRKIAVLIVLAISLFSAGRASATWNLIQTFSGNVSAMYFFSPDTGVIGFNAVLGGRILRTTDGGRTFSTCSTPSVGATANPWITDIWFSDRDTGWATLGGKNYTAPRLWRTTDGGVTWSAISNTVWNWASAVRTTQSSLVVTENAGVGIHVSTDRGLTWGAQFSQYNAAVEFMNNQYGVATNTNSSKGYMAGFVWTSDGGRNWQGAGIDFKHQAGGVFAVRSSQRFVAVAEDTVPTPGPFPGSRVFRSKVGSEGYNWDLLTTIPFQNTGGIAGIDNGITSVLFIQQYRFKQGNSPDGLYRSRDTGRTWTSIGGPNGEQEARFSALGCGDVIYAADINGNLWKTTDGGDGLVLPECVCINRDTIKALASTICDTTNGVSWIHNPNVGEVVVEDISVVDTNKRPFKTTALHIDSLPDPLILVGDSVAMRFGWAPGMQMDSTASDTALVRIILYAGYLSRVGKNPYDTIYRKINLRGLGQPSIFSTSEKALKMDSVTACSVDTSITLTNLGCDSLTITKATLWQASLSGWTFADSLNNPIKPPFKLPPNGSTKFYLHVKPAGALHNDSLRLSMHYQGRDSSTAVYLHVSSKIPDAFGIPGPMQFDSLATCASLDTILVLSNTGCGGDTLYLRQIEPYSSDWTLLDMNGKPLTVPVAILSNSNDTIRVRFAPKNLGPTSTTLKLHYRYQNADQIKQIQLSGFGASSGTFSYSNTLNAGATSICNIAGIDTFITFHNTSCDSTLIGSLKVSSPFVFLDSNHLPMWVHTGETVHLRLRFIPRGKGTQTGTATLSIATNNGTTTINDTLHVTATGLPGTSTFETTPKLSTIDFGTKSSCDNIDSVSYTVANNGCDTMTVTGITFDDNAFEGHADQSLPARVAPSGTLHITISIAQLLEGKHSGNAHIHYTTPDGSGHDTTTPMALDVLLGTGGAALQVGSPSTFDFGTITTCAIRDTAIMLTDSGCPVTITNVTFSGSGFEIVQDSTPPFTLSKKGVPYIIHVRTLANNTPGATYSATVTVRSNAPKSDSVRTFSFSGNEQIVDSVHFLMSLSQYTVMAKQSFSVYLKPDKMVSGKGIHTIAGVLSYPKNAFYIPQSTLFTGPNGTTCTPKIASNGTEERATFVFTSATEITLDPANPILTAGLISVVGDSVGGTLFTDSLTINGSDPSFATCVLSNSTLSTAASFSGLCGDSTIMYHLRGAPLVASAPLHPNPVTAADNYQGTIDLLAGTDGTAQIAVTDALGRPVSSSSMTLIAQQPSACTVDLSHQPAGTYFYTIHFTSASGDAQKNGMVILIK